MRFSHDTPSCPVRSAGAASGEELDETGVLKGREGAREKFKLDEALSYSGPLAMCRCPEWL